MGIRRQISLVLLVVIIGAFALASTTGMILWDLELEAENAAQAVNVYQTVASLAFHSRELLQELASSLAASGRISSIAERLIERCEHDLALLGLTAMLTETNHVHRAREAFDRMVEHITANTPRLGHEVGHSTREEHQVFSATYAAALDPLFDHASNAADEATRSVATKRIRSLWILGGASAAYFALVLLVREWSARRIVVPVQTLARAARTAMDDQRAFTLQESGPSEIRSLTATIAAFVGALQQQLADRTEQMKRLEHEIGERVRAETALQRSEAHLRTVMSNAPIVLCALDTEGRFTLFEGKGLEAAGTTPGALVGRPLATVEQYVPGVREQFEQALAGHPVTERHRIGKLSFETRFTPVRNGNNGVTGVIALAIDVTARQEATETRQALEIETWARQHEADLAHVLRVGTMGEMAAGLAHEINQPLASIVSYAKGCVRRLEAGGASAREIREAIDNIAFEAWRGAEVIRRIRSFVRKETTKRSPTDVNDLVQEAARFVEREARDKGVEIELHLASDLPNVCVDSIQIEQVILNLVRNAIDSMVGAGANGQRRIDIRTSMPNTASIQVAVSDTGPGLPPDFRQKAFEPFFTTKPENMGMGLSISRSIVEQHGGHLWPSSDPSEKSTFYFTLPLEKGISS